MLEGKKDFKGEDENPASNPVEKRVKRRVKKVKHSAQ